MDEEAKAALEADPYSFAIKGMKALIRLAIQRQGSMSDAERETLLSIVEGIRGRGNG